VLQHYLVIEETQKTAHCALCVQHSPTAAALLNSFLLNHAPPQKKHLQAERIFITRFRKLYSSVSVRMSRESKTLKKSSSDWLNSGNALIHRVKNATFVFPVLPGSAETQVIWGGILKRLLIAYFIGSISAKKYRTPFTCVKVIARKMWDVFETQTYKMWVRPNVRERKGWPPRVVKVFM